MTRYPWAPLERYFESDLHAAEHLGITRRTVQRWKSQGLDRDRASLVAAALRTHEYELWPEMVENDVAAFTIECAAEDCTERFDRRSGKGAGRGGHNRRFCSPGCRSRDKWRRGWKKTSPARREQKRRYSAAYYEQVRARREARRKPSVCEACEVEFWPYHAQKFCSPRCRNRMKMRRYRAGLREQEAPPRVGRFSSGEEAIAEDRAA